MINVTRAYLPPFEEYAAYLRRIWDSRWLTNHGPCVTELEARLREYLGPDHLYFVSNGTAALQIAIRALALEGEVITTPFSYVATTSSLVWERCTPVFADVDPDSLNLSPAAAAAAITRRTTAILATHVYGNPCDVEVLAALASAHGLRVIYDAAHAFGVTWRGQPIARYGDVTCLSFHATKVFHTVEGGAVATGDVDLAHRISYMRNFGHRGTDAFWGLGINAKNSELHAAMGLCILDHMKELIARRQRISETYDDRLATARVRRPARSPQVGYNYAYYPILCETEDALLRVDAALRRGDVIPRRYFYPALNDLPYVPRQTAPVAEDAARRVLCLPLYPELATEDAQRIGDIVREAVPC